MSTAPRAWRRSSSSPTRARQRRDHRGIAQPAGRDVLVGLAGGDRLEAGDARRVGRARAPPRASRTGTFAARGRRRRSGVGVSPVAARARHRSPAQRRPHPSAVAAGPSPRTIGSACTGARRASKRTNVGTIGPAQEPVEAPATHAWAGARSAKPVDVAVSSGAAPDAISTDVTGCAERRSPVETVAR